MSIIFAPIFIIVPEPVRERGDDHVPVEYVMERTGLARRTILEGKGGTRAINRVSIRPALFERASVDAFVRARTEQKREEKRRKLQLVRRKRAS